MGRVNIKTISVLCGLLAACVVFAVYRPVVFHGFVNWDDPAYVYDNPDIRSFGPAFFKWAFTSVVVSNWHPLTMVSYGLDHLIWGLEPAGYHLTSILFHAANVYLVFQIAVRLIGAGRGENGPTLPAIGAALAAALLFGLHPLRVESVAWIAERKDVLAAFFYLLSVSMYLRYHSGRRVAHYAASLAFFAAAMMSKPMAVSLPLVLLVLDLHPLGRFSVGRGGARSISPAAVLRAVVGKLPFFALSLAVSAVALLTQRGAMSKEGVVAFPARLATALKGYWFYLYKTVYPAGLAPLYPHPVSPDLLGLEYLGYAAVFVVITAAAALLRKRLPALGAAWLYYVVALLPVIGFVQVGTQGAADRYSYLPTIGIFILVGLGLVWAYEKIKGPGRYGAVAAAVAAAVVLGVLTVRQEAVWKDSVSLWTSELEYLAAAKPSGGAARVVISGVEMEFEPRILAYYNRAGAYAEEGDLERAIADYDAVIALNPGHVGARNNRGVALARAGKLDAAIMDFTKAIELAPSDADGYLNRSAAYGLAGQRGLAEKDAGTAASLKRQSGPSFDIIKR